MLPKELAKKVRYLQIYTGKAVNDVLAGEYHSSFKGRGMEFDEVREYQPGDEIRSIDWNVTARMGHPFIKRFVEERQMTVMLAVDLSASGAFGSGGRLKNEVAAELCALLAFSAIKNNDRVGLVVFTDEIELFVPPAKGTGHVLRIIRELLSFRPRRRGTNIGVALDYLNLMLHKRSVIFLVSDFLDGRAITTSLRGLARRHDLIAIAMSDPREAELPVAGLVELEDAETGELLTLDTTSPRVRERLRESVRVRRGRLESDCRRHRIDLIPVATGDDYLKRLISFFRGRESRFKNA
jgi:uncharacterized protein (DUF58 family)